jgi:hypothetical protein
MALSTEACTHHKSACVIRPAERPLRGINTSVLGPEAAAGYTQSKTSFL